MVTSPERQYLANTVMLVEDTTAIRTLQRFLLNRVGLQVLECADLSEAQAALDHMSPGLIVLDLNLPGGHGLNLLRHVDRTVTNVVVMSSMVQEHTAEHSRARADAFLAKPFNPAVFVNTVQEFLP